MTYVEYFREKIIKYELDFSCYMHFASDRCSIIYQSNINEFSCHLIYPNFERESQPILTILKIRIISNSILIFESNCLINHFQLHLLFLNQNGIKILFSFFGGMPCNLIVQYFSDSNSFSLMESTNGTDLSMNDYNNLSFLSLNQIYYF